MIKITIDLDKSSLGYRFRNGTGALTIAVANELYDEIIEATAVRLGRPIDTGNHYRYREIRIIPATMPRELGSP